MRIVVALGGNALLKRGEPLTAENQRRNVQRAITALAPLALEHELIITHGNGPQVGLLALQGSVYQPSESYPLDVLDAETEGMIGYLLEQEMMNQLQREKCCVTLLTQVEVLPDDPAFREPTKPIGPVYPRIEAERLISDFGWTMHPEDSGLRRVVASPRPQRILEISVIKMLVEQGVIVICAGGGGIPVVRRSDGGYIGVEAVIDKDHASALLAHQLEADSLLMLTDVDAVYRDWEGERRSPIHSATVAELQQYRFAPGSMGPKVEAACRFISEGGTLAGIGKLDDAGLILEGRTGTRVMSGGEA